MGRRQRDGPVDAVQRRRVEARGTSRLDPRRRPDRRGLECECGRRRFPRRRCSCSAARPASSAGWRGALGTTAEVGNDHSWDGAVYKGLAIGTADVGSGPQQYIYATDFHNGKIDVFDKTFADQTWAGAFVDPKLPKKYAPFGIQTLNGMVFVTYAQTQKGSDDERAGHGRGFVDAFATDGTFLGRVASHGSLNAPWGLAWAPADFGRFSNDLLVGNFGDGRITAYRWDGKHWHKDGQLKDSAGKPVWIDGLWAIAFGGDTTNNGHHNQLFFTAGPDDESAGAFGTVEADNP